MKDHDILISVVEQKSLNRASRMLNMSQPALTRKIQSMENEWGVALFERKGKRLQITEAGKSCYEFALRNRQLDLELHQALSRFRLIQAPESITIGASLTTLQSTLPDLLTLYTRDYPRTDIKVLTGKTHEVVQFVKDKKVDIGLVASSIEQPDIHCLPLFDDHLCLVLPSSHSYLEKASLELSDINNLPMIVFSKGTWYRILMDEWFHQYGVFPNVKMEIDSFEAILRLVSTCKTAALLPKSYLRSKLLDENELSMRNIPELEQTKRTTSLIYLKESLTNSVTRTLLEKIREYFPAGLPLS